jgi:glycosyltransferase involved in cell wall biosynthesis
MKRILHICNSSFYLKNFLKTHIDDLVNNHYEVHVICNIDDKKFSFNKKVILHNVKFPKSISPVEFLRSIIEVNKLVKSYDFDCVISHNRNSSIVGRIATYFSEVPINLYFAHGFYFHDDQNFFSYFISIQIERFLQKITSHTISQSEEDIKLMVEKKYIDKVKITHVGNGIDVSKFRPVIDNIQLKKKIGLPVDSFIITGVGRLVKGKGFQNLIDAFYRISKSEKNCYLMIVGGVVSQDISKYEKKIMNKIKKLHIEKKVILTGMVENVEDYLNCSDVYVLSSFREGVSRSMLEAMSCKIPVISTNIRGSREIIKNNYNGFLYEKSNINELISSTLKLKNDKELVKKITTNAYNLLYKFYTEELYNKRQLKIIKKYV